MPTYCVVDNLLAQLNFLCSIIPLVSRLISLPNPCCSTNPNWLELEKVGFCDKHVLKRPYWEPLVVSPRRSPVLQVHSRQTFSREVRYIPLWATIAIVPGIDTVRHEYTKLTGTDQCHGKFESWKARKSVVSQWQW